MSFRFPSLSPAIFSESDDEDGDRASDMMEAPIDNTRVPSPPNLRHTIPMPSSDGPEWSSPIVGTKEERQQKRMQKAVKKRRSTLQAKHLTHEKERLELAKAQEESDLAEVHDFLKSKGLRFGQYLSYVSNPANKQGMARFQEFFQYSGEASQVLDWWVSSLNADQARDEVSEWAVQHVATLVAHEARSMTKSKVLQTMGKTIDQEFVEAFGYAELHDKLQESAPVAITVLTALTTSLHAERTHTLARRARTKVVITSTALTCLGEYSHSNNLSKRMLGLYLYATGAQRQTITVLSTLGLSESYTNIISKNKRGKRQKKSPTSRPPETAGSSLSDLATDAKCELLLKETHLPLEYTGTLRQLSESMRAKAQSIAGHGLYSTVYDNINMMFRAPEQIIGRHDSQENGTCATLLPLFGANPEHLETEDYRSRFLEARKLELTDILLTADETKTFRQHLIFTILRIIVNHGGEGFKRFEKDLSKNQPLTMEKIPLHKTDIIPLPTWAIDESSITGNIEVDRAIVTELKLDKNPDFWKRLRFLGGDQLSAARVRSIENIRAGQETGYNAFFGTTWLPGLFHAKIADATGTLFTHWGKPNTGARNPGSLWFHNTRLDRLPITLTSLPSFRNCRDLIFVSLYARVLHCLLLVAGVMSLNEYLSTFGEWNTLVSHAEKVYDNYVDTFVAAKLRQNRARSQNFQSGSNSHNNEDRVGDHEKGSGGDMIFENAVLFFRDALISREFSDAVKAGDSGRVILVLKTWTLSFRGNGRTKYAYEMLHLIHNLKNIWSPEIRRIVMNNWLVNPTGKPESWVEIDLMQEHLNYWIKVFYKAHGTNATWEWLEWISPCVDVLRKLAKNFNNVLGADQGTRHAPADLSDDIRTLIESLNEHNVYQVQKGRRLDEDDDGPVKDVITVGLESLTDGTKNPLGEYNNAFLRLQRRRKMVPVIPSMQSARTQTVIGGNNIQPGSEHDKQHTDDPPAVDKPQLELEATILSEGNDEDEADTNSLATSTSSGQEMLMVLTAADVDLDMDIEMQEDDITDDESQPSCDEMD